MKMALAFNLVQRLDIFGGISHTVFRQAEKLLYDTKYQEVLYLVASRKDMERYRSVMDFLFAEVCPEWQTATFNFYRNPKKYPPLRDDIRCTEEWLKKHDELLWAFLRMCMKEHKKNRLKHIWSLNVEKFYRRAGF